MMFPMLCATHYIPIVGTDVQIGSPIYGPTPWHPPETIGYTPMIWGNVVASLVGATASSHASKDAMCYSILIATRRSTSLEFYITT